MVKSYNKVNIGWVHETLSLLSRKDLFVLLLQSRRDVMIVAMF